MINRLEAHGSYDDTLIIVVADHGVSVRPEQHPRRLTPETVGDIAAVPFFIKRPSADRWRHRRLPGGDGRRSSHHRRRPRDRRPLDDGRHFFIAADRPRRKSKAHDEATPLTFSAGFGEVLGIARYHLRCSVTAVLSACSRPDTPIYSVEGIDSALRSPTTPERSWSSTTGVVRRYGPCGRSFPAQLSGRVIGGDGRLTWRLSPMGGLSP